jgi:hemerythrin-like domain-containing protein
MTTPNLLNDDGSASMATMLMLSHHAFRRDIMRFEQALEKISAGDHSRDEAISDEWTSSYRAALHGHHVFEDTHMFPDMRNKQPELASALDKLTDQHRHIDPILERGDEAFADLTNPEKAKTVITELKKLLDEHLVFEEAEITPALRSQKQFPTPPDDAAAAMYAQGFAWSMQGIAPNILEEVHKLLPDILTSKLPSARDDFEKKCKRVWGEYKVGVATTPIPEGY